MTIAVRFSMASLTIGYKQLYAPIKIMTNVCLADNGPISVLIIFAFLIITSVENLLHGINGNNLHGSIVFQLPLAPPG